MKVDLEKIVEILNRENVKATYGAVAGVLGRVPQGVMIDREKPQRNSWVVNAETNMPTGYRLDQLHPNLMRLPIVLHTREKLQRFLDRFL